MVDTVEDGYWPKNYSDDYWDITVKRKKQKKR
jgi:hypothetical protein